MEPLCHHWQLEVDERTDPLIIVTPIDDRTWAITLDVSRVRDWYKHQWELSDSADTSARLMVVNGMAQWGFDDDADEARDELAEGLEGDSSDIILRSVLGQSHVTAEDFLRAVAAVAAQNQLIEDLSEHSVGQAPAILRRIERVIEPLPAIASAKLCSRRAWLLVLCCCGAAALVQPLAAQTPGNSTSPAATEISLRPGQQVVLDTAPCLVAVQPAPGGALEIARATDTKTHAVFTAPAAETSSPLVAIVERGTKLAADGKACESPVRSQFNITVTRTPEVPPGALDQSFRILMAAFVIAVLLENAFALLFNWRLFLEFFVGKAWRTPIMFLGALIIVRAFDLDLVGQLFRAYNPDANAQIGRGTWFTSMISAMVLAGGSVGVNRVLVALGFRSQLRPEALEPELEPTEAYVAIRVQGLASTSLCQVNMDIVDPIPADTPRTLGFVGGSASVGARFAELLFPVRSRIPPSGGMRVSTSKAYRISVTDLQDGKHYDTLGRPITRTSESQLFAFAPKAIVNFTIRLKRPKP